MSSRAINKTALITGATSGIGLQCAHVLAAKAYDIVIIGSNPLKMEKAISELQQYSVKVYPLVMDLSLPESAENVFNYCLENHIEIDVLICNAGISLGTTLINTNIEDIRRILYLHIIHSTLLCRLFGDKMRERKTGNILIVSSLTAYTPYPTMALYAASKRYLHSFSKSLRAELKPQGVNISELCPGGVDTPIVSKKNFFIATAARLGVLSDPKDIAEESIKKMFRKKAKITPCLFYRILIFFLRFIPHSIVVFLYKHTSIFSNQKTKNSPTESYRYEAATPPYALITGACSGIGWSYAQVLAKKGYHLVLVSNQEKKLEEKTKIIKNKYNIDVQNIYIDLSQSNAATIVFQFCREKKLRIEILINNAGVYQAGYFLDMDKDKINNLLYLHTITLSKLCRYFGEMMQENKSGYILNMSSLASWMPYPKIAVYAASKRYIKNFSRSLRTELLPYNVSVIAVAPGAVNTDLLQLAPQYRNYAIKTGIMMSADKVAKRSLSAMFRKKSFTTTKLLNLISIPLLLLLPLRLIIIIENKFKNIFIE